MVETEAKISGMTYLDSVLQICEEHKIEIETVKKYLSPGIIERLESEALDLNVIKKGNTLDV